MICRECQLELKIGWMSYKAQVAIIYCPTNLKGHNYVRVRLRDAI